MRAIITWLNGKKTALGAISLLLWITIYALPAFHPEYNWITVYGTNARDFLLSIGINLDRELFNAGVGVTVLGLGDKVRKIAKGEE